MSENQMYRWDRKCLSLMPVLVLSLMTSRLSAQAAPSQWPQHLESPGGLITVYEPQPDKFDGNTINARAAVSLTPPGAKDPEFGAMWFQARVSTDRDARTVSIQNIQVKRVKLPNASDDQEKQFGQIVQQQVPSMNLVLSLDQLEATLSVAQKVKEESQQLQNNPPQIIFTQVPTTLVVLDGPPKLQQSGVAGVMTVVNTPFVMLFDLNSKTYYLKAGTIWLSTTDIRGSWVQTSALPAGVSEVGAKLTTPSAQPAEQAPPAPPGAPAGAQPMPTAPTNIYVAEVPTELISSSGPPTYIPIPPGDLLYMNNTQSDVFMEVASQHFFVLLSGRWFTAPALAGPWAYIASDKLPPSFARIPADSPKANVLVSVAGTQAAKDARYDAYIPQTTVIQRNAGSLLQVTYDGAPQFVPIEGTQMTYARNCADPVIDVDNTYYCCDQAVWYQSPTPNGPWVVSTAVPPAIYTMPPSCPIYYCRYCYVYDSTPDSVYCGYLPGYTGSYVYGPTVVYGTGYNYPAWEGNQYYAYPNTWGFDAQYDYYAGGWGFGTGYYYGSNWFANRPYEHRWWGSGGYIGYRDLRSLHDHAGDAHDNRANAVIDHINIYNRSHNVRRNAAAPVNRAEAISAAHEHSPGEHPEPTRAAATREENNVYVGHDGSVYRRTDAGWESRGATGWTAMKDVPEANNAKRSEPARVEHPSVETPARENPARENPVRENPVRENPVRENPVRENPARENPVRQAPAQQPARSYGGGGGGGGGLEEEHAARQRSAEPARSSGGGGGDSRGGGGGGGGGGRR
jgi:hypothetical protein